MKTAFMLDSPRSSQTIKLINQIPLYQISNRGKLYLQREKYFEKEVTY